MLKKILMFALTTVMAISLSSCGGSSFDHKSYLTSVLDATYKGEFGQYKETIDATEEEIQQQYENYMDSATASFSEAYGFALTDEQEARINSFMKKIYKQSKYEVVEVTEVSKDEYSATVKISPISNIATISDEITEFATEYAVNLQSGEYENVTAEEIQSILLGGILDILDKSAENVTYSDDADIAISIKYDSEAKNWYLPDNEFQKIDDVIFDI